MLMNYYRQMDRTNIQFDFMMHRAERSHYDDEIEQLGGHIYRMPQIRPGQYRKYFKLLDEFFIAHPEYRVVHSHINENSSFVLRAAKRAGIPCRIAHSHLSDLGLDRKLPFRIYARATMRDNPSHYFACSLKAGEWLFGKKIQKKGNLTVLNNAVNVREFLFDRAVRQSIREEFQAGDRLVIGHIGRFNEQKNHSFLIDLFHVVHQRNPEALLVLVGEGHLRPQIERKIERLGLTEHIRFLGVRSDIPQLLQGMDLFLFPSLFEGLPVVLVEAQAAGLRCVVSDAITRETDVTGRLEFISLGKELETWADRILDSDYQHMNTMQMLRDGGYDTETMARWLADFYSAQLQQN